MLYMHKQYYHTNGQNPLKNSHLIIKKIAPIWLALWGLASYLRKHLGEYNALNSYVFVISSPAISYIKTTSTQTIFPLVSPSFITGKGPYNTDANSWNKIFWYPQYIHQEEHLNLICESSPYVPKLEANRESSWELPYTYSFRFKWGGPEITDQQVDNPTDQQTYDEPYTMQQRIQISNPLKQDTDSLLHSWDFRRGIVTQKALERMCSHLETDTDFEPDTGQPPRKKRKLDASSPIPRKHRKKSKHVSAHSAKKVPSTHQKTKHKSSSSSSSSTSNSSNSKRNLLHLIADLKKHKQA